MHLQEEFDEAERLYRRALDITEKTIGPDHPSYGRKLGNLAILLEKLVREEGSSMICLDWTLYQATARVVRAFRCPSAFLSRVLHAVP